ncbi:MAG: GNAT family N-acetyltransferase [Acidobacteria bacterium]|nr:GNAT family N-acetyltransferase [Acidobacteriota bacterium]
MSAGGERLALRRAVAADVPRLARLLAELGAEGSPDDLATNEPRYRSAFAEIDADARQHLVVAELDGRIVGTLVLIIIPNLTFAGRRVAQVENVVVDPAHRGEGIGTALLLWAMGEARRQGCYRLQLTTRLERTRARRLYARLGFVASHEGLKYRVD